MFSIHHITIKWKLRFIILTLGIFLCLTSGLLIIWHQHNVLKETLLSDLSGLAEVTAINNTAALTFGDTEAADEILSALSAKTAIEAAFIYDHKGVLFSQYIQAHDHIYINNFKKPTTDGYIFADDHLTINHPVMLEDEKIGSLIIVAHLDELYLISFKSTTMVFIVMLVSLFAAGLAAIKFEKPITLPLAKMAETARQISEKKDYSLRAEKLSKDEVGQLVDAFNHMLEQIEEREKELEKHKEQLEKIVEKRTLDLQVTNEKLNNELAERRKTEKKLTLAKEDAEEATLLKNKFISLISHDLRSPLQGITSILDIFKTPEEYDLDEEKKHEMLDIIKETVNGSVALLNRLLDVSKITTGKMKPSKKYVDINILVSKSIEKIWTTADKDGVEITNKIPQNTRAFADPLLLGEVIQNLLSNAVKFSHSDGKIVLFTPDDSSCLFAIKDSGKGIDKDLLSSLFRYDIKTSTSGTAGEKGAGLGLPLCMDIIKAHGGNILVESALGEGSTFFIEIPLVKEFLLIVDDQEIWRNLLAEQLEEKIDFEIIEAENGMEALEITADIKPSLIITDIDMPEMNGLELLENIKNDENKRDIPVIVNSAMKFMDNVKENKFDVREKALSLGAEVFISKPTNPNKLLKAVKKCLKR